MPAKSDSEAIIRDIKRKSREKFNAEEKITLFTKAFVVRRA
ncbi:hypothetical protein ACFL5H_03130 [Candidatus Latescibacterota bacterium]